MAEISVEDEAQSPYSRCMETRVALLENTMADFRYEIREVKAMVRDLATEMREGFRSINVKFEVTDKAIADLRVDMEKSLSSNLRWTITTILGFGVLGLTVIGLLIKFH